MSIIDNVLKTQIQLDSQGNLKKTLDNQFQPNISAYQPSEEEAKVKAMIRDCFVWSDIIMRKPRREWNDMSTLDRMTYDQMAFNIYQPNNGQAYEGDPANSWKSNAVRPIVRNKVMSIAAHATARLLFPKVFAYNEQSEEQEDAATAMRDLIEWASQQNDYARNTMYAVINALVNPLSIMHVEYGEAYRTIKTEKVNGKWQTKDILDEERSGFKMTPVPVDELYVADFYQENIQLQQYLIWRRVQTYEAMAAKYSHHPNFQYVRPGVQVIYNDANTTFYDVYDSNLRQSLCEEILFYSKPLDLFIPMVNGVLVADYDNPNPRLDKQYPFIAFGYENFDEGRALYKKSLAFKMQPDADIINTLYPMIIDGTYLNIMPPMIITGEEEIGADVVIPGVATTLINPESSVTPLRVAQDVRQGMETLFKVEESINQSSQEPIQGGASQKGTNTAYEISKIEQNAQTVLGLFVNMIGSYVKQYGKLVISDIIQYLTIPEVDKIIDNGELIYKTFIVHDRKTDDGKKTRKIDFDLNVKTEVSDEEELAMSYDILEQQKDGELYKVNPKLFREFKYMATVSPDVLSPMSDDLERAFGLEIFDKSIAAAQVGVPVDMEEVFKDFVLANYPKSKNDIKKYIKEPEQVPQIPGMEMPPLNPNMPGAGQPASPAQSPMAAMMNNPLVTK